jgi:hypothetical protein
VAECAECRDAEARIRRTEEVLSELAAVETAPDLTEDLRERIAATRARTPRWAWAAATCGIAVLALTAGIVMRTAAPPSEEPPAPQRLVGAPESVPDVEAPTLERIPGMPDPVPEHMPSIQVAVEPSPEQSAPEARAVAPIRMAEATDREVIPDTADHVETALPTSRTVRPSSEPGPAATEETLDGLVLLLGEPQRVPPSGRCYLAVTRLDGSTSVSDNQVIRDAAGAMQAVQVSNVAMPTDYRLPQQED